MTADQLLSEVDDIIRSRPSEKDVLTDTPDVLNWWGRASAAIERWDLTKTIPFLQAVREAHTRGTFQSGMRNVMLILHECYQSLRMATMGPVTTFVTSGKVFQYFDELRKLIESASQDLLFVDPYLDADFASRYLPLIKPGTSVRLLTVKGLAALVPAVAMFNQQQGAQVVSIRTSVGMHDRFLFVDRAACYQSGASFKDGGKNAPTTVTQIVDAFTAMHSTYEDKWSNGKVVI